MNKAKLSRALLSAFPSRAKFAMLLSQRFNVHYDTLTPQSTVDVEYHNIVVQVAAEGWLEALARAAHEAVPGNPQLADLMVEEGLTSGARVSDGAATVIAEKPKTRLERLVRENSAFTDIATFLARLSALEGQTCRIELSGSPPRAIGTGFLVGPDLVMTNQHVIEGLEKGTRMICRFDYLVDAGGVQVRAGAAVPVADDWLVRAQPPDPSDESLEETDPPAPENLDFALIRLAQPVGEMPRDGEEGPDNPPRGWIAIDPALQAGEGDDLFILQHPEGAPLKLGVGRLTALHGNGLRWRHDVATEGGSSGSPVFNRELALIGLHHAGDPNYFRIALFNQAIPIARIVHWLQDKVDPFWTQAPP
ncbi:trypsin-like peptidase domain-containing protein [Paracoccus sp. WLY502]|uniref:trypsin-like peptidase domain-containing protein n=1 Tax=Paracoccus yibinensis TaxID=3068891 RepID=UPI002796B24A|nr:trypsin-like peptidase domain-containing protein [Paracoccus sp. WLY502]MDQ1899323.1 trypsin-like peptidase domain-containing protein [Paracoccus sp. WLY502]